jgi:hypothetical protein
LALSFFYALGMEKVSKKPSRKKLLLLIAGIAAIPALLIAGVFAGNTVITVNSGADISLGAGYSTATTCDSAVDVAATQNYYSTGSAFKVEQIRISNINQTSSGCAGKTLTAVIVKTNGSTSTATWSIASLAANTQTFIYGLTSTSSGNNIYSSTTLTEFVLSDLATIAIGIS